MKHPSCIKWLSSTTSTDLNARTLGFSDFVQQISEIIRLVWSRSLLRSPARFSSVMSDGIRCLSTQALIGHQIHCWACCCSTLQSELKCQWNDRNVLVVFACSSSGGCGGGAGSFEMIDSWEEWRLLDGLLKQRMYTSRPSTGTTSPAVVLTNGLTMQVGCSVFRWVALMFSQSDRLA